MKTTHTQPQLVMVQRVPMAFTSHPSLISSFSSWAPTRTHHARPLVCTKSRPLRLPINASSAQDTTQPHSLDTLLQTLRDRRTSPLQQQQQQQKQETNSSADTVYLVGTGPGDPGLLTLRALQLINRADVVLYDRLVSQDILSFVNPRANMVYVGKEAGFHTRSQHDIHLLLEFFAASRRLVIRLKGGDPFVFGRGGEETDFLEKCGIRVVAVPGITAASGIAAQLGIPLTMRGVATSVRYVTGHVASGTDVDFGHVDMQTTYVIYMGLAQLPSIADQFIRSGLDPQTPAVAVERGTTPEQRVLAAPLIQLSVLVADAALHSPTLIIVGQVVALAACWEQQGQLVEGDYWQQLLQQHQLQDVIDLQGALDTLDTLDKLATPVTPDDNTGNSSLCDS